MRKVDMRGAKLNLIKTPSAKVVNLSITLIIGVGFSLSVYSEEIYFSIFALALIVSFIFRKKFRMLEDVAGWRRYISLPISAVILVIVALNPEISRVMAALLMFCVFLVIVACDLHFLVEKQEGELENWKERKR